MNRPEKNFLGLPSARARRGQGWLRFLEVFHVE